MAIVKEAILYRRTRSTRRWRECLVRFDPKECAFGYCANFRRSSNRRRASAFQKVTPNAGWRYILLTEFSVAALHRNSGRCRFGFELITPQGVVEFGVPNRQAMEEWLSALKLLTSGTVHTADHDKQKSTAERFRMTTSTEHTWYVCSHARPVHCNYCRERLSGVASNGLSCEVCKMKSHKRCAPKIHAKCKWTNRKSVPTELKIAEDGTMYQPHQWIEGNLPMSSKCAICDRICGSVLKLQDWRCAWCNVNVHDSCRSRVDRVCNLGSLKLSIIPPVSLLSYSEYDASMLGGELGGGSPLLVLVNSKSGDNQGLRMIRKFKRLLNPAQVYDIVASGPEFGLNLFRSFDSFRVLVCGGDGTVGWVFTALDKLNLHAKCQIGVLPLGTGNDLARVLGWGHVFDSETQLPHVIERFERAHSKMLDRWSVFTHEGHENVEVVPKKKVSASEKRENSVADHLTVLLSSDSYALVIKANKELIKLVRDYVARLTEHFDLLDAIEKGAREDRGEIVEDTPRLKSDLELELNERCDVLLDKLHYQLQKFEEDAAKAGETRDESGIEQEDDTSMESIHEVKGDLRLRKSSLTCDPSFVRQALHDMMEEAEKSTKVDDMYYSSSRAVKPDKRERFRKKRSKTTPSVFINDCTSIHSTTSPSPSPCAVNAPRSAMTRSSSPEASQTSGVGISPDPHFFDSAGQKPGPLRQLKPPSIGDVQPPTPCLTPSTSEPSQSFLDVTSSQSIDGGSPFLQCKEPHGKHPGLSLKPVSESDLVALTSPLKRSQSDVKSCRSDSSIFVFPEKDLRKERSMSPAHTGHSIPAFKKLQINLVGCGIRDENLVSELLILNADVEHALGNGMQTEFDSIPTEMCREKKVMNNYFGIGLDAKIALDFHNKREELADKARSRSKLFMMYGMLGGKELLHRTFRNLEQRILLECDGRRVQLPALQGLVILNIPSYSGGANFWGTSKGATFTVQSFDDKVLEVVALFSVIHVASSRMSKVVRMQNHRIAQARQIKIIITGDEPIPVQVDGEPWLQPPGHIHIVHKNRAQVLVRNPQFEATLRTWQEQNRTAPTTPTTLMQNAFAALKESAVDVDSLLEASAATMETIQRELPDVNPNIDGRILKVVADADAALTRALRDPAESRSRAARNNVADLLRNLVDTLNAHLLKSCSSECHNRTASGRLRQALDQMTRHVERYENGALNGTGMCDRVHANHADEPRNGQHAHSETDSRDDGCRRSSSRFTQWLRNRWKKRRHRGRTLSASPQVMNWSAEDVGRWLTSVQLDQYHDAFVSRDITGDQLYSLERSDLKLLGMIKTGHIKRFQKGLNDLKGGSVDYAPVEKSNPTTTLSMDEPRSASARIEHNHETSNSSH
uniref:Diacylglycerol kinase n=1 Tax=Steinernema glaseri TaxID=37863 RepID=A0A1I7Z6I9_9BILA